MAEVEEVVEGLEGELVELHPKDEQAGKKKKKKKKPQPISLAQLHEQLGVVDERQTLPKAPAESAPDDRDRDRGYDRPRDRYGDRPPRSFDSGDRYDRYGDRDRDRYGFGSRDRYGDRPRYEERDRGEAQQAFAERLREERARQPTTAAAESGERRQRPDPFGGAKPRDEFAIVRRQEEQQQFREAEQQEQPQREQPPARECEAEV